MFSSALKSISPTNISSNYQIAPAPASTAGPWKIYDAKRKSTGKPYTVFIFERKALDAHGSSLGRSGAAAFRRAADEVVERLRKEASSLARLRHPCILELVEPVEDTRGGGLQFVTEAVTASLSSLLADKDDQEKASGPGRRGSRFITEDADGIRRRRELEIDELEIQKGLLQISKALEFLHENAGLVHGNLNPDTVLVNAKSDWKLSGLAFCSPPANSTKSTSFQPMNLAEILNNDPRLPRAVQLNLDFTSPDFVLDNNLDHSSDMFSLGLVSIALYNSPHQSPLQCQGSLSTYKRLLSSSSTAPSPTNGFLSSRPIPKDLASRVLPRLVARRPAQRMTAREFQQSEYFDNILVSTIRFLDNFPAKTPSEKTHFLRGLKKVLPSFPKSIMEKKLLPALLDEMKDRELLSLILRNVFTIMELLPSAPRIFADKVRPHLKEIFVTNARQSQDKDSARDAGLMVTLEHMGSIAKNVSGKDFKDDILPIILTAIESPTPSIVDASLGILKTILPVLDFPTIKNELFPVVAAVFSKTTSLAIKIRGLHAFVILCGGSMDPDADGGLDGLNGEVNKKTSSSTALDKFTMQEKILPLIKAIKTKEPAVMMAALTVLQIVGRAVDAEYVALEILSILWGMSLGPLLSLRQFQAFMTLIRSLSRRVEEEQIRKLQDLSGGPDPAVAAPHEDFLGFSGVTGTAFDTSHDGDQEDFESLVTGKLSVSPAHPPPSWDDIGASTIVTTSGTMLSSATTAALPRSSPSPAEPTFAWSTPMPPVLSPGRAPGSFGSTTHEPLPFGTSSSHLSRFGAMAPSQTQYSQPMQPLKPTSPTGPGSTSSPTQHPFATSGAWSSAAAASSNPWALTISSPGSPSAPSAFGSHATASLASALSLNDGAQTFKPPLAHSPFSLPPPPLPPSSSSSASALRGFQSPPALSVAWTGLSSEPAVIGTAGLNSINGAMGASTALTIEATRKSGLAKYESLL